MTIWEFVSNITWYCILLKSAINIPYKWNRWERARERDIKENYNYNFLHVFTMDAFISYSACSNDMLGFDVKLRKTHIEICIKYIYWITAKCRF